MGSNVNVLVSVNDEVTCSSTPKKYVALLTQYGTDDPIVVVLENTLGEDITWAREGVGFYIGNVPNNILTTNKTTVFVGNNFDTSNAGSVVNSDVYTSSVQLSTFNAYAQDVIDGVLKSTPITVEVYP